jgi:hypothetical protein
VRLRRVMRNCSDQEGCEVAWRSAESGVEELAAASLVSPCMVPIFDRGEIGYGTY